MKKYEFYETEKAEKFAAYIGIERSFLFNSSYGQHIVPITLYVFKQFSKKTAVVILYPLTNEIGLWVSQEMRGRGIGKTVFKQIIERELTYDTKRRLFAFLNPINFESKIGMSKILSENNFNPILNETSEKPTLWFRPALN